MAQVKLDLKGLEIVAKRSETAAAVKALAEEVADNVRSQGRNVGALTGGGEIDLPVEVNVGETSNMTVNRAKAWVNLAHPGGLGMQAKYGIFSAAASSAGLEIKGDD